MTPDSSALETALSSQLDALWRYAWRLTGNDEDASDLVQRTCLRALEQRHQYKEQGKVLSWLLSIEHRIWLNEMRSRQIRNHQSFNTLDNQREDIKAPENLEPESSVFMDQVVSAVMMLPEAQRHVVMLVCVEGFSYRETAAILDTPIGTVMSRLARGRITIGRKFTHSNREDVTGASNLNNQGTSIERMPT